MTSIPSSTPDTTRNELGAAIHHWRDSNGWTLRELAQRVSADFTYLSKIENGHDMPSRQLCVELDRTLHADGAIVAAWLSTRCPTCGGPLPARLSVLDDTTRNDR